MEESEDFKWAVKVVLKRQMRDLIQQLREQGEELAVLAINMKDHSSTYFGTPLGEWFISEQKNLTNNFSNFCKTNAKKSATGNLKLNQAANMKAAKSSSSPKTQQLPRANLHVQETPTMKITVPKHLSVGVSEQELGGLVGRIVASQLAEDKEKGDGSSGGTKFDSLIEALGASKGKSTPVRSTRSGRKVTNKYLESLRENKRGKGVKLEAEDSANEGENEESIIMNTLTDLEAGAIRKVQVKTGTGKNIDVQKTALGSVEQLEALASSIVQELHASKAAKLADKKQVKVVVRTNDDDEDDHVKVEITGGLTKRIKNEDTGMDDSDMEYSDFVGDMEQEVEDFDELEETEDMDRNDPDFVFNSSLPVPFKATPRPAVGNHGTSGIVAPHTTGKLVRKKYMKPLSERMPMECEHCGQYVAGKSNLKSHIKRVHLKVKNHKCSICSKGFWSNNALESHMLSVHTRRCDSCQEYVVESVPWGSGIHMRMKRDVICTCGSIVSIFSSFGRRRQYLREDEPDEDGEIPTRSKSNAGTKYACGTCGKLFMKKSNCERHSRAHSDYKGITCDLCGSAFAYENSLKRHMETEHGIVKHACDVCGKNYSNETALKVHYIKAHTQQNLSIGENLVMIVKEKEAGNDTADLTEQMEEIMEAEAEEGHVVDNAVLEGQTEHIVVTQRPDGSSEQHIMVSGPTDLVTSESQDMVVNEDTQLLVSQADIGHLEEGQVVVTQGEGGQVHVTTGDPGLTHDNAQRIVQQAIQDGHVIAQEGNMSIIIKQLPLATPISQ